jgi:hypothetical protein
MIVPSLAGEGRGRVNVSVSFHLLSASPVRGRRSEISVFAFS